ncbi:MAG TPA: ferritin family protein [Geobacteraceae bacterium]
MMNVYDFAMRMEEEHCSYYERMAAQARSNEVKEIFTLLADSEREHHEHLKELKLGANPSQVQSGILDRTMGFIPELADGPISGDSLHSDDDGYRHAVKQEEMSIKLYEKLADQESDPAASQLLRRMADEERHHLEEIEYIYDFVETPDTYLAWGEFSNLREY